MGGGARGRGRLRRTLVLLAPELPVVSFAGKWGPGAGPLAAAGVIAAAVAVDGIPVLAPFVLVATMSALRLRLRVVVLARARLAAAADALLLQLGAEGDAGLPGGRDVRGQAVVVVVRSFVLLMDGRSGGNVSRWALGPALESGQVIALTVEAEEVL